EAHHQGGRQPGERGGSGETHGGRYLRKGGKIALRPGQKKSKQTIIWHTIQEAKWHRRCGTPAWCRCSSTGTSNWAKRSFGPAMPVAPVFWSSPPVGTLPTGPSGSWPSTPNRSSRG